MDAPDENSVVCKEPSTSDLLVLQQSTAPSSAGLASRDIGISAGTIRNSTLQTSVQVLESSSETSVQLLSSSSIPSDLYQQEREAVEHMKHTEPAQGAGDLDQANETGGVPPEEATHGLKHTMTLTAVQVDIPNHNCDRLRDLPITAAANAAHKKNKVHVPLQVILRGSNRDTYSDAIHRRASSEKKNSTFKIYPRPAGNPTEP